MSYIQFQQRCLDCNSEWNSYFGMVGSSQIGGALVACPSCQSKRVENSGSGWKQSKAHAKEVPVKKYLEHLNKMNPERKEFYIEGVENERLKEWNLEHDKTCEFADVNRQGAIGGRLSYSFTPTGIGTAVTVSCACGEVKNLTDYDSW